MNGILFGVILAISNFASAQDKVGPTSFAVFVSEKEESTLVMNCSNSVEKAGYLACSFNQKSVTRKSKAVEEAAKSLEGFKAESDKKKVVEELKKECNKDQELKTQNEGQSKYLAEVAKIFRQSCECMKKDSFACVQNHFLDTAKLDSKKCGIMVNEFKMSFKKISKDKYITDSEPFGACNVINMVVLERDSKTKKWKFTQTRLATDSTPLCKNLEVNKPNVYIESYFVDFPGCDFISLGV